METGQQMSNPAKIGMLLAISMAIAIGGVHFHVVGAMMKPLGDAYGWSRGDIAFALTIASFVNPFTNIAAGMLADRYAVRTIAIPGIFAFALGTASLGLITSNIWTWYLGYVVFTVAGSGISSVIFTKLVVQHFTKRRGLALATSLAGSGVLVSTVPHIVLTLEEMAGVNNVYPLIGLISFILLIIPCWLFLPRQAPLPAMAPQSSGNAPAPGGWRVIIASPLLWKLGVAFLLVAAAIGTFIVHLQAMLVDGGLSRADAASVALFVGPAMIVGRLGTGMLYDILPTRLVTSAAFALPALACLWLLLLPLDFTSAALLAVLIGLGMGSEVDALAYLSSRYFGAKNYGLVFGLLISVYGFAIGMASWLVGMMFDATGNYVLVLTSLCVGIGGAMLLILSLGPPPRLDELDQPLAR